MTRFRIPLFAGFVAYSATLLLIEWKTSQNYVRNFFTDIQGPVQFYAVNTTLSVFLLWSAALILGVCIVVAKTMPGFERRRRFYLAQALVFAYLGLDDRFMLHEWVGAQLNTQDHYLLMAVGAFNVLAIAFLADREAFAGLPGRFFALAVGFSTVMLVIDAKFPGEMVLRLSLEDLSKTWGALFFFLFAWERMLGDIAKLRVSS
jgi:hypothetical protein